MKAIILAAGQGSRLKKYTHNMPKGMLDFLGKTLIERQIELFREVGINEIIIIKGYAEEKINYNNVKYYINRDYSTTNMVYSMLLAREEFSVDIIVSYSDIIFEKEMLLQLINNKREFSLVVDDNWKSYWTLRYGNTDFDIEGLSINSQNEIISVGSENPEPSEIDSRFVGLLKFKSSALEKIVSVYERNYNYFIDKPWKNSGESIIKAYMTDLIQALIDNGQSVYAERYNNGWLEFDTNEDYEKALQWSKENKLKQLIDLY
jgi:choline kinase